MSDFKVGFSRVNINPMMGVDIHGYFIVRKADGILDDLEAILKHEQAKEAKISEGEKFIVKETKNSLFITEKETKIKLDNSDDEKKEIKYRKISLFDED
jgi:hypothetical protein